MARKGKSTGVTQLSMLPGFYPDTFINEPRKRSLRIAVRAIIRKEGFYNFAKLAEEALTHSDEWILENYGVDKDKLSGILHAEFAQMCVWQETIESFLEKVRTIPSYKLNIPDAKVK